MSPAKKFLIIIAGCGRLGSYIANKLSREAHSVVVIDQNVGAFDGLTAEFSGFKIEGDATEFAVLKEAKADKADLLIAVTRDDNVNLMVAQVAKRIFNVGRVMARVFEIKREEIYRELGIETICPTSMAGDLFLQTMME
jgi:trk system potassium uptake protein TrkA